MLAAALSLLGTLAACSAPVVPQPPAGSPVPAVPPASAAESFSKYNALRADLVAALQAKMPGIAWTVDSPATMQQKQSGNCMLYLADMKSETDIVEPSKDFEDVFAAADPVLEKHGFPAFGGTDPVPGGWTVTRSTDAAGATVTIGSKGMAYLRVQVPVASANCNPKEIPAG